MDFLQGEVGAVLHDCFHPQAAKVTHILFYGSKESYERWTALKDQVEEKESSERWTALKDQVEENKRTDAETVFKAFANSFEKSSSHWQARDEHLADIKQAKHQTTAELDTYINTRLQLSWTYTSRT